MMAGADRAPIMPTAHNMLAQDLARERRKGGFPPIKSYFV